MSFTELNLDEASLYSLALRWPAISFAQIGFCKQSILITERTEAKGGKQLKVEGVCVSGKTLLVSCDWLWKLFFGF